MKKLLLLSLVVLSVIIAPMGNLFADGAKTISFQGVLLDSEGNPLNDVLPVRFELYDAQYGGNQLWGETQSVEFEDGYFNVYLGTENPLDLQFESEYYLQITVADGTPYDRTPLSYSPYAFSSETAKLADLAQDIPDGSVTLAKLADEVKIITGDVEGTLPELYLAEGAVKRNIQEGDIEGWMLSKNISVPPSGAAAGDLTGTYPDPKIADEAVTTRTIETGAITWSKLQSPLNTSPGTILGWDGTKWVETDVPTWEQGRVKDIISGRGLYTEDDGNGFLNVGIADDGIVSSMILDGEVMTDDIADMAVTNAKLAADAVTSDKILDGEVMTDDIADMNVTNAKLAADAVTSDKILDGEVMTDDIADLNVTNAKIATDAITTDKIMDGEVMNEDLADGAVDLTKLADGTELGQVIYWDGTEWRYNEGTPHRSHVLKWDFNVDSTSMEMQWAQDAMSIPFYYDGISEDENEEEATMITLEKNYGNPTADDNVLELIVNHEDANSALVAAGSGIDSPNSTNHEVATIYGESDLGYKGGVMGVFADVTSLDLNDPDAASVAGLFVHETNGLDNGYKSGAVAGYTFVEEASAGTHHTGLFGEVEIANGGGHAKGVIGQAWSDAADVNVGVLGTSKDAQNVSLGIAGVSSAEWDLFDDLFAPGADYEDVNSVGVFAYNGNTTSDDLGLLALTEGEAPAAGFVSEDAPAIEAMNFSEDDATIEAMNIMGPALMLAGDVENEEYVAYIENMNADGRGMLIESTSPTAFPYNWPGDPTDADDATLVVRNNDGSANRIAIKTYGDIVANSSIYGSMFVANDSIVIGEPGNQVVIKAPENPGDPLQFDGDVDVTGTLTVDEDIIADGMVMAPTGDFEILNVSDAINASTATADFGTTTTDELTANGFFTANQGALIDNGLVVDEVQVNGDLTAEDGYFSGDFAADGMTELVDLGGGSYLFSASDNYDGMGNPGVAVDGDIATTGNVINPMPPTAPLHLTNKAYVDAADDALAADIDDLQDELDNTQAGAGLDADGNYVANGSANYISGATTLANADDLLDAALKAEEDARIAEDIVINTRIDDILDVGATFDGTYDLSGVMNVSGTLQPDGGTVLANAYDPNADIAANNAEFDGDLYVEGEAGILDDGLGGYVFTVVDDAGAGTPGAVLMGDYVLVGNSLVSGDVEHFGDYNLITDDLNVDFGNINVGMGDINVDMGNVVNPIAPTSDDHLTNKLYVDDADDAINARIDDILDNGADLDGTYTVNGLLQPGATGTVRANDYEATADLEANDIIGVTGEFDEITVSDKAYIGGDASGALITVDATANSTILEGMVSSLDHISVLAATSPSLPVHLTPKSYVDAADQVLQDNIDAEETARIAADDALQTELDDTQDGAGLDADGGYTADGTANYIDDATSLFNADIQLDTEVKALADALDSFNATAPITYDAGTYTIGMDYDGSTLDLNGTDELYVPADGITATEIAEDAVGNSELADDAVESANIKDGEVMTDDIADLNVTTGKLAADAVDNSKLADDAVQTENIVDLNVTTGKLAADAVDNSKLADDAVQTENIVDGDVTNAKLANSSLDVIAGNGLLTTNQTIDLGGAATIAVNVDGLAGDGLVENGGVFDVNTDATLQIVSDEVGIDLANENTWTADQTFPTAYAENFETVNGNFKLSQSTSDDVPWANAINSATGNAVMELGYGTDGSSANAEYGISFNDAATGNLRTGMGYNEGNWSVGVVNDGGDMAGFMTSGADDDMNLGIMKDGAYTFSVDIDGDVTANTYAGTWDGNVIDESYIDAAIVRDAETPAVVNDIDGSFAAGFTIQDNAVETDMIADANVTNAKLANSSLDVKAGNGINTTNENIELGNEATLSVDVAGLAGDGLVENGGAFDVNTDATLQVVSDAVGINLANSNTWTADQTFPNAYANKFEADYLSTPNYDPGAGNANAGVRLGESNNTGWLNFRAEGNDYVAASIGRETASADGLGLQFSDIATGDRRAGIGFDASTNSWSSGLINGTDMIGFTSTGSGDMNLVVMNAGVPTFGLDIDGNVLANDIAANDVEVASLEFADANNVDEITTTVDASSTNAQLPTAKATWDAIDAVASSLNLQSIYEGGNAIALDDANGNIEVTADDSYTGTEMLDVALTQDSYTAPVSAVDVTLDGGIIDGTDGATRVQGNLAGAAQFVDGSTTFTRRAGVAGGVMAGGNPLSYAALGVQEDDGGGSVANYAGYFINNATDGDDVAVRIDQNYYGSGLEVRTNFTGTVLGSGGSTINSINSSEDGSAGSFIINNTDNTKPALVAETDADNGVGMLATASGEDAYALKVLGQGTSLDDNPAMYVESEDNSFGQAIQAVNESGSETVLIQQYGDGNGISVYTDATIGRTANFTNESEDGGVVGIQNTNPSSTKSALDVEQDGDGAGLRVEAAKNALTIDQGSVVLSNVAYDVTSSNAITITDAQLNNNIYILNDNGADDDVTVTLDNGTTGQKIYLINNTGETITDIDGTTVSLANGDAVTLIFIDGSINKWFVVQ